ncbi:hypothetical protein [Dysgonomonas sp. GY617]|uniref:hypothetical protein n=1 Tax=Dysgonomonas sp. GY617 TaxID=2780420 RepID=UPI00188441DA|nr:hypothetical protein [Dysgonomonas sp. GY617]MBF0576527.1 hypothetical protein [Dysgonomonas sp. GY617]
MIRQIFKFIKDTGNWSLFLMRVLVNGNLRNPLKKDCQGKTVAVLANGPSLRKELHKFEEGEEFKDIDFIVLNFFAFEEIFFKIKPKHYCFADPMFFQENHKKDVVQKLFHIMENRIDWDINIYIPSSKLTDFLKYSGLKNRHLAIIKMNFTEYSGYESLRHFFYEKGLAMPRVQTVANLAIYLAINKTYSKIHLYGVDHTYFDSLCINKDNILCNRDVHFYDGSDVDLKPILRNDNDIPWKISEYLQAITYMFKSHDLLASYARYLNLEILNYTKCSMIDSYDRI